MPSRRQFLADTSLSVAAAALLRPSPLQAAAAQGALDWPDVRREFNLSPDYVHLGLFFLASHPRPVREAVERYRRLIDENPVLTVEHALFEPEFGKVPRHVAAAIAGYIGGAPEEIALTGNTTEGLALVYHGLPLRPGDEVLTTSHDHYSHHESIRLATERAGATWRKIPLWDSYRTLREDEIADRIRAAVRPKTRAVGITWVHSASGAKLPLRRIADALAPVNAGRSPRDRVLLIVDGVHGIGVEDPLVAKSGCDVFCAGTHKWLFAPRGTGFVWATADTWARLRPTIPSFGSTAVFDGWMEENAPKGPARADWFSPGGFHAFEHYWAVPDAIAFHKQIGPPRVTERIHALNTQMKEGLAKMAHVEVHTPMASALSSGITCFDVKGLAPGEVVRRLLAKKIIATTTPYRVTHARVAPGLPNTPEEVETTLSEIRALAAA
jgi:isopenicillin-N epimerase